MTTQMTGTRGDDSHFSDERRWADRVPPELEWDAGDAAMVVADVVGRSFADGRAEGDETMSV